MVRPKEARSAGETERGRMLVLLALPTVVLLRILSDKFLRTGSLKDAVDLILGASFILSVWVGYRLCGFTKKQSFVATLVSMLPAGWIVVMANAYYAVPRNV